MMAELNLTPFQTVVLILLITVALVFLWCKKSYYQLDIKPKADTEGDNATRNIQETYGAYIQAQGNYYN